MDVGERAVAAEDFQLKAEIERLKLLITYDRSGLAAALNDLRNLIEGYSWIVEDEWGSYSYEQRNDETLRKEFRYLYFTALDRIQKALRDSGQLAGLAINKKIP